MYKSLSPWLIPSYFILFDAVVNWIVFLIFFLDCSWPVYRKTTDFFGIGFVSSNFVEFIYCVCVYVIFRIFYI